MSLNALKNCVANLKEKGISARIENNTVYVEINDYSLELSDFEIKFQAGQFKNKKANQNAEA